ncbi:MAG: alpha/beta hydrolase [Pseudomonadota bacterium]
MSTSRSDFVRIRGLRYHVRRWGAETAPKLMLLHGLLDASATWEPVAKILAQKYQVMCPDWRGLGHSEWPQDGYWFPDYVGDLAELMDHYAPTPIPLVGHSMGAQIGSLYAGARPARVSRFACLDGLFLPDMDASQAPKRMTKWLDDLKQTRVPKTYASFEELAGRVRHRNPQLGAEKALFIARCWASEDGHGRVQLLADPKHELRGPGIYRAAESMAVWKDITAPTLFLDGGKSVFAKAIPADERKRRRACFRDYREDVIADAGHMLHFDAPEETGRRIAAFLASP